MTDGRDAAVDMDVPYEVAMITIDLAELGARSNTDRDAAADTLRGLGISPQLT